jgi:hypothetical protein
MAISGIMTVRSAARVFKSSRTAAEPVRDVADGGRRRRERLPGWAVPGEVVADDGVAAVVAEGLDLKEQAAMLPRAPSACWSR